MKKRIGSLLLAVLLVVSLVTCAAAAEPAVLSGLRLSATRLLGQTSVQVFLTEEGATNGRIEVTYDAEKLELVSVKAANESWFTSVNSEEEGLVSFAWAASDLGAEETRMFRLVFRELGSKKDSLVIGGEVTELYDSGKVLETKPSKVSIEVKEDNVSDVIIGGITSGAVAVIPSWTSTATGPRKRSPRPMRTDWSTAPTPITSLPTQP